MSQLARRVVRAPGKHFAKFRGAAQESCSQPFPPSGVKLNTPESIGERSILRDWMSQPARRDECVRPMIIGAGRRRNHAASLFRRAGGKLNTPVLEKPSILSDWMSQPAPRAGRTRGRNYDKWRRAPQESCCQPIPPRTVGKLNTADSVGTSILRHRMSHPARRFGRYQCKNYVKWRRAPQESCGQPFPPGGGGS